MSAPGPTGTPTGVSGADGLRDAVARRSDAIGDLAGSLDSLAVRIGHTRISVWDVMVVVIVIVAVFVGAWLASRGARRLLARMTRLDATQKLLAEKLISIAVWGAAILLGIDVLGIDLTALAVFSGAFGLAIGFGLQKTFGNLIAGIILLLDKSIKPGDVIAIADQSGQSTFGQIRKIGIRAVSLTTRDQKEYLIPNENLMVNQVENWSYSSRNVRIQIPVGISYKSDIALAETLMLQAAREANRVLTAPPPTVWLETYGESWLQFVIHCWIEDPEEGVGNVRSDVLKRLWHLFIENGIEVPYPQRDVNLRETDALAGLRAALAPTPEERP